MKEVRIVIEPVHQLTSVGLNQVLRTLSQLPISDTIDVKKNHTAILLLVVTMMNVNVALLRAINVGGHARISMSDLRSLLTGLEFEDVRSLMQTGNLVFRNKRNLSGAETEQILEDGALKHLGLSTDFMVRSADEITAVVAGNPFPDEAERDPGHLVVLFLKNTVEEKAILELQARINGPEALRVQDRELYAVYPEGIARSRLTNSLIESKLRTRVTGRNWNTVLKLRDVAAELAGA